MHSYELWEATLVTRFASAMHVVGDTIMTCYGVGSPWTTPHEIVFSLHHLISSLLQIGGGAVREQFQSVLELDIFILIIRFF